MSRDDLDDREREKRANKVRLQTEYLARKRSAASPEELHAMTVKHRAYAKAYRERHLEANRARGREKGKAAYAKNGEVILARHKARLTPERNQEYNANRRHKLALHRAQNPLQPRTRQPRDAWTKAHPERVKANLAAWRAANPTYAKTRYANDAEFVIMCRLRARLSKVLKSRGLQKTDASMRLVGCSLADFKQHLELQFLPGMTWANRSDWHIDHIQQCCTFDLSQQDQREKCFHYTNLRPLWTPDNLARPKPKRRQQPLFL